MYIYYLHVAVFYQRVKVCVIDHAGVNLDLRVFPRVTILTRVRFVPGDISLRPSCYVLTFASFNHFSPFIIEQTLHFLNTSMHISAKR